MFDVFTLQEGINTDGKASKAGKLDYRDEYFSDMKTTGKLTLGIGTTSSYCNFTHMHHCAPVCRCLCS